MEPGSDTDVLDDEQARIRVFFTRLRRMTTSTDTIILIDEHGYGYFSRGYAGGRRIWMPVILSRFRRKTTSLWKLVDTNSLLLIWLTLGPRHISCSVNNARKVEGKVLWDLGAEQCITSRVCAKWYGVMSSILSNLQNWLMSLCPDLPPWYDRNLGYWKLSVSTSLMSVLRYGGRYSD